MPRTPLALHLTLALLPLLLCACGGRNAHPAAAPGATGEFKGQYITITDSIFTSGGSDTVRFGHLHEGAVGRRQLRLRNASSRPIVIERHETSCGCIRPEYERQPLAPGGESPAAVEFDTRGEWGWQMKLLRLYPAGGAPLKIYIEAEVE